MCMLTQDALHASTALQSWALMSTECLTPLHLEACCHALVIPPLCQCCGLSHEPGKDLRSKAACPFSPDSRHKSMYADTQILPRYDAATSLLMLSTPGSPHEKALDPRTVRKNDTSAKSMHEWMGVLTVDIEEAPSMSIPAAVSPLGNYAAQIQWEDGFNQVRQLRAQNSVV